MDNDLSRDRLGRRQRHFSIFGVPRWAVVAIAAVFQCLALFSDRRVCADGSAVLDLVLAVDVSGSVSMERFALQRQGYAAAFRDPRVVRAITASAGGTVSVTMTQWTGPHMQVQVVPWMSVTDRATSHGLADAIDAAPRQLFSGGTSISGAIDHAAQLLADSPSSGARRVIDVSGDGTNNRGRPAAEARDAAVAAGIVINGLPILALEPGLESYYRSNVIGGPGAFAIAAESYESFAEAIVRKLVLEIAGDDTERSERRAKVTPPAFAEPIQLPVGGSASEMVGSGESRLFDRHGSCVQCARHFSAPQ